MCFIFVLWQVHSQNYKVNSYKTAIKLLKNNYLFDKMSFLSPFLISWLLLCPYKENSRKPRSGETFFECYFLKTTPCLYCLFLVVFFLERKEHCTQADTGGLTYIQPCRDVTRASIELLSHSQQLDIWHTVLSEWVNRIIYKASTRMKNDFDYQKCF